MKFYIGEKNGRHFECRLLKTTINDEAQELIMDFVCYEITEEGGEKINSEINKEYYRTFVANNLTKVNPATGDYVPDDTEGAVGEWDYFNYISQNLPIKVTELKQSIIDKNKHRLLPIGFGND